MMILVAGIALMFIGAGVLLVRGFIEFSKAEANLQGKYAELQYHYNRNPFPSANNLQIEKNNLTILDQQLADILKEMGKGQVLSMEQSPPKFIAQFWTTRKELLNKASERGTKVASTFDFGFGRHMQGAPPAPQDVARLTQQLMIVQRLCGVFFDVGITELVGLSRQEFEVDANVSAPAVETSRRRSRGSADVPASLNIYSPTAGLVPEGELYGRWRFTFRLSAKEGALLSALNALARDPLFVVVSDVEITGDDSIKTVGGESVNRAGRKPSADSGVEAAAEAVPMDLRVVCGRDVPVKVKIDLDVYQFVVMNTAPAGSLEDKAK